MLTTPARGCCRGFSRNWQVKEQDQKTARAASSGSLKMAIREARIAQAQRADSMADLRGADMANLELLGEALMPVIEELPRGAEQFDFQISGGERPRLWIDMLVYVAMGRDRRTYRVLKSTRSGRKLLFESLNLGEVVRHVTGYVAHQLIEREKALDADDDIAASQPVAEEKGGYKSLGAFAMGFVLGAAAVAAVRWLVVSGLI